MAAIDKKLVVQIVGDATSAMKTYGQVIDASKRFGREVEKNGLDIKAFGKTMLTIGGAITGALTATVIAVSKSAGEIEHLSRVAGTSAESFQKLAYAAKQDDVDMTKLATGMTKLSKGMMEASNGTGEAAKAFKAIGVNVQLADGQLRSTDQVLLDVADRFSKMTNPAEKSALAMQIFGKSGAELVPFLEQGRDGMTAFGAEAERLGIILSDKAVSNLDTLGDELDNLKAGMGGLGNQIASELAPYMLAMVGALKQVVEWFGRIPGPIRQAIVITTALTGALALGTGAAITFGSALWAAMAPLMPFVIAAGALTAGVATLYSNWEKWVKFLDSGWGKAAFAALNLLTGGASTVATAAIAIYKNWDKLVAWFQTAFDKPAEMISLTWGRLQLFILDKIRGLLEGFKSLTSWIPGMESALGSAIDNVNKTISAVKDRIEINNKAVEASYKLHFDRIVEQNAAKNKKIAKDDTETAEQLRIRLAAEQAEADRLQKERDAEAKRNAEERIRNEESWADRLAAVTLTKLELINREERKALEQANLTEKSRTDLKAYYTKLRLDLAEEEAEKIKKANEDQAKELAEIRQNIDNRLFDQSHNEYQRRLRDLQQALRRELAQEGLTAEDKYKITKYYHDEQLNLEAAESRANAEKYQAMAANAFGYIEQILSGQATLKDIIKKIAIDELKTLAAKQIGLYLAGVFKAWADSGGNPFVALPRVAAITAANAAASGGLAGAIGALQGLAEGGLATGPAINLIGEGQYNEAVIPLSPAVFKQLGAGVVENLPKGQSINNQSSQVINNFNINGYIDKTGLKQLVRDIDPIMTAEKNRRGLK